MGSMRRTTLAVLLALVSTSFGTAAAPYASAAGATLPSYRVDIVVPNGVATAINEAGDIVGWQTVNGAPRAFAHRAGQLSVLPTAADRPLSVGRDINDAGVVVGYAYKATIDEPGNATRWTPGSGSWSFRDLGFLSGDLVSEATGINEAGHIVGRSNPRSVLHEHGFFYADAMGMRTLGVSPFVPNDINERGIAVGNGYATAQRVDSLSGAVTDLGAPSPYAYSHAYAVNDGGQVAGALTTGSGNAQSIARYDPGAGWQVLGGLGEGENLGWGINSAGTVVGVGWARTGSYPAQRGVIYLDAQGGLLYVDDLLEAGSDWSVYRASDINDSGQIAGHARSRSTGQTAAVRLSPVGTLPVPAAPSGLSATPRAAQVVGEANRIDLRWSDNSTNETSFEVERRAVDAAGTPLTGFARLMALSANVSTYSDTDLAPGARYEYRVRAVGTAGASAYSNTASATAPATLPDSTAPRVTITSPSDGATVSGVIKVKISVVDAGPITRVELLVDTKLLGSCSGAEGLYTCRWDTRKWSNTGWTMYARAWDAGGNLGIDATSVRVSNQRKSG